MSLFRKAFGLSDINLSYANFLSSIDFFYRQEPEIQSRIDRIMPVVQSVTKTLCFCCDESKEHQHMKRKEFLKGTVYILGQ